MRWGRTGFAGLAVLVVVAGGCVDEGPGSDFDRDGLTDEIEDPNENFALDPGETSFIDPDTDREGLCDGQPERPLVQCDGCEDCNNDGFWEPCLGETDPLNDDTDNDGISDRDDPGPLDNLAIDCSGGQNPRFAYGDSLPPGKPFPGSPQPTPTPGA